MKGQNQAVELAAIIQKQLLAGMPIPQHFVSAAKRAAETWAAIWDAPFIMSKEKGATGTVIEVSLASFTRGRRSFRLKFVADF